MASRAHVIHDYSFHGDTPRQRRPVRFQTNDPVVLPRSSSWDINGGLILAALAATALVTAGTYAVYNTAPPALAETPTAPLERDYQPDAEVAHANALKALSGPTLAAPDAPKPVSSLPLESQDTSSGSGTTTTATPSSTSSRSGDSEVIVNDSAPGAQDSFPQPSDNQSRLAPSAPYPNPTMTPPEGIAPSEETPRDVAPADTSEPLPVRENPYR